MNTQLAAPNLGYLARNIVSSQQRERRAEKRYRDAMAAFMQAQQELLELKASLARLKAESF